MGHQPDPKYSIGQRVVSFRGAPATVTRVQAREQIGKSHRVGVKWDDHPDAGMDDHLYYEEVFEPHGEMTEDDVKGWASNLNPEQFGSR